MQPQHPNLTQYVYAPYPYQLQATPPGTPHMVAEKTVPPAAVMHVMPPAQVPQYVMASASKPSYLRQVQERTMVVGEKEWVGQLRKFGGQANEDANKWLIDYIALAEANAWQGKQMVMHLGAFLEDQAAKWLETRSSTTKADWTTLKKDFKQTYVENVLATSFVWAKIMDVAQQPHEDPNVAIFELEKAFGQLTDAVSDATKVTILTRAIHPDLAVSILKAKAATFEEAIKLVRSTLC